MRKILLTGNGFDLAHGLKTSYNDFLHILKNWNEFYSQYTLNVQFKYDLEGFNIGDSFYHLSYDLDKINYMNEIIKRNSWIKYYMNSNAELDGWIDFEKELYPAIEMFDTLVQGKTKISYDYIKGFEKYCGYANGTIYLKEDYKIGLTKIKKNTLMTELRKEFEEFLEVLEIYLEEFVWKCCNIKLMDQIKNINVDYVISFNYTETESAYGIKPENVHHIHGSIRNSRDREVNNLILGIDEKQYNTKEFLYYMKFFQRIQKRVGIDYKKFIEDSIYEDTDIAGYELHIYGHSLDITDEDILKYLMVYRKENKTIFMPDRVVIYYYNQKDYEQKVINLITLFGRNSVELWIEKEKVQFIETENN